MRATGDCSASHASGPGARNRTLSRRRSSKPSSTTLILRTSLQTCNCTICTSRNVCTDPSIIEGQVIKEIQSNSLSVSGHETGCLRAISTQELMTNLSFNELDVIATTRFQDLITNLSFRHFDLIAIHVQDVITNLNFNQLDLIPLSASSGLTARCVLSSACTYWRSEK